MQERVIISAYKTDKTTRYRQPRAKGFRDGSCGGAECLRGHNPQRPHRPGAEGAASSGHGYAVMSASNEALHQLSFNYERKRRIAVRAAEFVKNGETVMLTSGACCTLLAEELAIQKNDVDRKSVV